MEPYTHYKTNCNSVLQNNEPNVDCKEETPVKVKLHEKGSSWMTLQEQYGGKEHSGNLLNVIGSGEH